MAVGPRFPLKKMVIQLRTASLASAVTFYASFSVADSFSKYEKEFKDGSPLDWIPIEELSDEQKKSIPNLCCGAYVPPARTDADASLDPEKAPFHGYAVEQSADQPNVLIFKGNVAITQGNRSISTDKAVVDKQKGQAQLTGNIELRDPNVMIKADAADINTNTGDASFENARFVLYQTRIHGVAESLKRFGENIINLEQSEISSCEPGDDAWSIRGSEISLHPEEHYGTAENMRVNIGDVPVLYMPYVRFPVGDERLTGFLTPTPGYSRLNGYELSVPFYWNIAPNYDATFTPHYMSNRGYMLETDFRALTEYFKTDLNGSFINNDLGGYSSALEQQIQAGTLTEAEAYPYRGHNRWYAKLDQTGGLGQSWSTTINYADLSDRDYLRDMYSGSVDSNRQAFIRQMMSADYRTENWSLGIKTDEYRLLTTTSHLPYRELPRIHVDGTYQVDDWVLKLNNEYVNFVQNRYFSDSFTASSDYERALASTIYGERINTDYSLTWDKSYTWGFIKPSVSVKGLAYELVDHNLVSNDVATPHFAVPQASLDAGLYFEREAQLFGDNFVQTLEPRAFYFRSAYRNQDSLYNLTPVITANGVTTPSSYVNFDSSDLTFNYNQLFRTTRFAGGDRLDDANQLSLAVSTAFLSQSTGIERLRMSIGQIFYANDRRIMIYDRNQLADASIIDANTRTTSDWAAQVSGQVSSRLNVSADAAYDQHTGRLDNANAGLHYLDDAYRIVNLTYRYAFKPVVASPINPNPIVQSMNQLDTSVVLPVNSHWSVIARNNHDFTYGVELDTFAGLEYNDCCYRVRFVGRRWLRVDYTVSNFLSKVTNNDYEPGIMLELELKGLGSMDRQISDLLEKTVTGFKDREKNLR